MVSIAFDKFTLSNGLDVILHEDHTLPIVAVNVWYHVGSKDEEQGRTGFAHLFEHVMFEGSKNHNASYFDPLQKVGAVLNGSTTPDRTNYWENVPSNYLELALWLESDRMGYLLDALDQKRFDIQRDVVKNERRQSYENRPYGMASLALHPALYPAPHPYNWPTIGSQADLDAAELDDIKDFFRKYYAPSNASLAIAGDISPDGARALVEKYFGDLPPGPPINRIGRTDTSLTGQKSITMQDKVQLPRRYLVWPTGPQFADDQAALELVSSVLGDGKSSRLYKLLVLEKQIAREARVYHYGQEIAGEFHIEISPSPGHTLDEIEEVVWKEIDRLKSEPPTQKEIERAKNRIENQHVRQLERVGGFGGRADILNFYNTFAGDPSLINTDLDRYMKITPEEVQQATQTLGDTYVKMEVQPEKRYAPVSASLDRSVMPDASDEPTFTPPIPGRSRLSNGLEIVFVERPGLPVIATGLVVRAGGVTDPADMPGLAHMTAINMLEGTSNRSGEEIAEEMEFLGTHLSSDAMREYMILATETLTSTWPAALEVLADVAKNATFPEDNFQRVQKERLTDLARVADNPGAIAARASASLLFGVGTTYGHPVSGTETSVAAMTVERLSNHYGAYFGPQNATLIVVGDASESDIVAEAEKHFGNWEAKDAFTVSDIVDSDGHSDEAATIFLADKPGAAQSVIRAGHLTIPRAHEDFQTLNMVNYIFGGQFSARLNTNLRQNKGYSYGYSSSVNWFTGPSAWFAGGSVQSEVTKESVIETLKEYAQVRGELPITEDEFNNAKDGILRSVPSAFETHGQTLQQLVRLVMFNLADDYFATYADRVEAITLEDVHRVATERVLDSRLKLLVVGDKSLVEPGLKELGVPIVHVDYEGQRIG